MLSFWVENVAGPVTTVASQPCDPMCLMNPTLRGTPPPPMGGK